MEAGRSSSHHLVGRNRPILPPGLCPFTLTSTMAKMTIQCLLRISTCLLQLALPLVHAHIHNQNLNFDLSPRDNILCQGLSSDVCDSVSAYLSSRFPSITVSDLGTASGVSIVAAAAATTATATATSRAAASAVTSAAAGSLVVASGGNSTTTTVSRAVNTAGPPIGDIAQSYSRFKQTAAASGSGASFLYACK